VGVVLDASEADDKIAALKREKGFGGAAAKKVRNANV
jgi:hypothetical protein